MADEKDKTKDVSTETTETEGYKKFDEAMAVIEAENEAAAETAETETVETPAGEETADKEVSDEITETIVSEETKTKTEADETTKILEEIDPDVLDVFRDYYDDKEIIEIAKTKPEFFDDVRAALDEDAAEETTRRTPLEEKKEAKPAEKEMPKFEELKLNLDANVVGEEVKTALDSLVARVNEIGKKNVEQSKGLLDEKSRLQSERDQAFNNRVDACFDRQAKVLENEAKKASGKPILDLGDSTTYVGKQWPQLTRQQRQQVKLRNEIFAHARVTAELRQIPIEKAIAIEVNRFRNQDGDKSAEQRVLDKLQRQNKRFTNPPTRRHSTTDFSSRKFGSEAERITALMDEAHKQAGDEE